MAIYSDFEPQFAQRMQMECRDFPDPSHDFLHVERVVQMAKHLAILEGADLNVVVPAAYLHDVVLISKADPRRKIASKLSAEEAGLFLKHVSYPEEYIPGIQHAIEAHSFSAGVTAKSLEAKVVQDADRLDGLGAVGVARCFAMSGLLQRPFYSSEDPFCMTRIPDDQKNSLDHFFVKLFKVPGMLQTESGRREGAQRVQFLQIFANEMNRELTPLPPRP